MSPTRAIVIACCTAACAAAAPAEGTALFTTGDQLPGTLAAINGATGSFESSTLAAPATIHLAQLLELRSEAVTREVKADHEAVVTLTNGNVIHGQVAALSDQAVVLDTWFAGQLELRRSMVESLRVVDRARSIYSGPQGAEGWLFSGDSGQPAWHFSGGTMTSDRPGSAARDLKLPDRVAVSFDLAWKNALRFRLILFSDDLDNAAPPNAYVLDFNRRYTSFTKHWSAGNAMQRSTIGNAGIRQLGENEKVRVELFADRADGNFVLHIDGEDAATWRDPEANAGTMGGGIHLVAEDTTPLRVSRLTIEAWDGRVEESGTGKDAKDEEAIPSGNQRMLLRNGDVITGRVLGVEDGRLVIETKHAKIHLPVGRMSSAVLHRDEDRKDPELYQRPKLMNGDVRAWFPEGGCVVFRLDGIEGEHFVGFNQAFGTARFRREAFGRVEFNIYKDELEPLRSASGGW